MSQTIPGRIPLVALLVAVIAISACGKKDAEPADSSAVVTPPASTTPLRVTDIQVGKGVGPDRRIVAPAMTFGARDTIYVSVITDGATPDARLTATWMYNNTRGISEADEMISSQGGVNVSEFHISSDSPWQVGSYTVEIKLDGISVGEREFRVQ